MDQALETARTLGMTALLGKGLALTQELGGSTDSAVELPRGKIPLQSTVPDPQSAVTATFRCDGDYWTIAFGESTVRLKDSKGLQYIALLLHAPGQEFPALDLVDRVAGAMGQVSGVESTPRSRSGRRRPDGTDSGPPLLDLQAKAEYRGRLRDLREELDEAVEFNDLGRVAKLRAEMEFISKQLSAAVGLGGRDRKSGAAERARLLVTKRIKAALRAIAAVHASLGDHLRACVKTGYVCVYGPSSSPVRWEL